MVVSTGCFYFIVCERVCILMVSQLVEVAVVVNIGRVGFHAHDD